TKIKNERLLHALAVRVFRDAQADAISVPLWHRQHDGGAAPLLEGARDCGQEIFTWAYCGGLAPKMVHKKSGHYIRAGFARNARSHPQGGEICGANRASASFFL